MWPGSLQLSIRDATFTMSAQNIISEIFNACNSCHHGTGRGAISDFKKWVTFCYQFLFFAEYEIPDLDGSIHGVDSFCFIDNRQTAGTSAATTNNYYFSRFEFRNAVLRESIFVYWTPVNKELEKSITPKIQFNKKLFFS